MKWEDTSPLNLLSLFAIGLMTWAIIHNFNTKPTLWIMWIVFDALILLLNVFTLYWCISTNRNIRLKRKTITEEMKILSWKLFPSGENCPVCKQKLIPHYGEVEGNNSYTCPTKTCNFNK